MSLSRRAFFKTSTAAATFAVGAGFGGRLLAFPEPARAAWKRSGEILLNSNENPYGPYPSVHQAMTDALAVVNRYPDYEFDALWDALCKHHGVKPEQVTIGSGSTDILRMAAQAFCIRNKTLLTAAPTFEALAMYAARANVKTITVPLRADFAHDLDAMAEKAKDGGIDLIYICNPNNPTASITPRAEIEAFLAKLPGQTYVLIDEAYHHFTAGAPGYVPFADAATAPKNPRAFVARTFSKIYGMAGLRVGYAVGQPEVIAAMAKWNIFDSPNCVAARAAVAAIKDSAATESAVKKFAAQRDEFVKQASARQKNVIPSHANFLMMETGKPIRPLIEHFKKNNVMIGRPFPPYLTHARISIGTPEEMQEFWKVWDMQT